MFDRVWLSTRDLALTACFAALYVSLSFLPMFQIIGVLGKTITAATIMAPIIGMILGPYLGGTSAFLGGLIGLSLNPSFHHSSLVAGVFGALCAGLLCTDRRGLCAALYLALFLVFGLVPSVGPLWLYPPLMWFQLVGFLVLISPLQSWALKSLSQEGSLRHLYAFFTIFLVSTLASQIAGSLAFELMGMEAGFLKTYWQGLTFIYPVERVVIAMIATPIGVSLHRISKSANLLSVRR